MLPSFQIPISICIFFLVKCLFMSYAHFLMLLPLPECPIGHQINMSKANSSISSSKPAPPAAFPLSANIHSLLQSVQAKNLSHPVLLSLSSHIYPVSLTFTTHPELDHLRSYWVKPLLGVPTHVAAAILASFSLFQHRSQSNGFLALSQTMSPLLKFLKWLPTTQSISLTMTYEVQQDLPQHTTLPAPLQPRLCLLSSLFSSSHRATMPSTFPPQNLAPCSFYLRDH